MRCAAPPEASSPDAPRSSANLRPLRCLAWSARRGSILLAVGIFGGIVSPGLAERLQVLRDPQRAAHDDAGAAARRYPGHRRPSAPPRSRPAIVVGFQMLACPGPRLAGSSPLQLDPGIAAGDRDLRHRRAPRPRRRPSRGWSGWTPSCRCSCTLSTLALVPLTAPPIALWLLGIDLSISPAPSCSAADQWWGCRCCCRWRCAGRSGPDRLARWGGAVDGALVWLVVLYGFAVMDGLAARLAADPAWVVQALVAAFVADYGLNARDHAGSVAAGPAPAPRPGRADERQPQHGAVSSPCCRPRPTRASRCSSGCASSRCS